MIGALKVLVGPDCSLVDFFQIVCVEFIVRAILIILQDGKGMKIDMRMDLAFGLYDNFFNWIHQPENRFQKPVIKGFDLENCYHSSLRLTGIVPARIRY
jgi:hypothetical protein